MSRTGQDQIVAAQAAAWFFESSDDIFVVIREGIVLQVNPAWTRLTGFAPEEIVGGSFWAPVHPEDLDLIREAALGLTPGSDASYEHRLITKAGGELWVRARTKLSETGDALVALQDITAAKVKAMHMARSKRMSDLLRGTSGVSVWVYDPVRDSYDLDPPTAGTRTPEEDINFQVPASMLQDAIHADDRDAVDAVWQRALATGAEDVVEYRSRMPFMEGIRRLRSAWIGSHRAPNGQWVVYGLTQDITDLVEARDAALAASEAKTQFLANMSHELRTPLNAIIGFSDIMRTAMFGPLAPKYAEYAGLIHESGGHLLDLINDVLDMSKIEAERFDLAREEFDAREAVSAALRLVRVQADANGVALRGVLPAQPLEVDADRRALKQIVLNLVSNALKFTNRGGQVTVTARPQGENLEITVADSGVGISKSDLARLGRPYEQAGEASQRSKGTGLGLSLVRAFAELHGGTMSIESTLGEGTAVTVRLPVLLDAPAETPDPASFAGNVVAFKPQR